MNKEKFTFLELTILSFFMLNSFLSIIMIKLFNNFPTLNIIVSIFLAFIVGYFFVKKYLDGFEYIKFCNKKKYLIINFILAVLALTFAISSVFNLSLIIKEIILPNMNNKIISLTFLALAFILAIKGIKSISIFSNLMFIVYIIVVIINFLFNLLNVNHINLLPLDFNFDMLPFFKIFILTISPLFMLWVIPKEEIINFEKFKKYFYFIYFIFYGYFILKILFIVSILGIKYFSFIDYPEINLLKMINIFNFFERMEELLIINIFIQCLITSSVSINYSTTLFNKMIKSNKNCFILAGIILFITIINLSSLSNNVLYLSSCFFIIFNLFYFILLKKDK